MDKYRELREGERIADGDEFRPGETWRAAHRVGQIVTENLVGRYRRPIPDSPATPDGAG